LREGVEHPIARGDLEVGSDNIHLNRKAAVHAIDERAVDREPLIVGAAEIALGTNTSDAITNAAPTSRRFMGVPFPRL
jgi:hypothetical protein